MEDHENPSRLGVIAWALLACPVFGVGVALDAGLAGWIPVNAEFTALLLGVPAVLTLLTAALARLSLEATFVLASGAVVIAGAWLLVVLVIGGALI